MTIFKNVNQKIMNLKKIKTVYSFILLSKIGRFFNLKLSDPF